MTRACRGPGETHLSRDVPIAIDVVLFEDFDCCCGSVHHAAIGRAGHLVVIRFCAVCGAREQEQERETGKVRQHDDRSRPPLCEISQAQGQIVSS